MKNILLLNSMIAAFILTSCKSHLFSTESKTKIDQRLVGTWEGSEKDNQLEGLTKKWLMTRNEDGTFSVQYSTVYDGEIEQHTETGTWWVEGNRFHEKNSYSGLTDTYIYKVLDDNQIHFRTVKMGIEIDNPDYEFVDKRVTPKK